MANHEPTSCYLCEPVPAEHYRRLWKHESKAGYWHVIADGQDLMARLRGRAHYCTVLAYQPDPDGRPSGYRGPLYAEWDSHDPAAVLEEVRTCLQVLQVEFDLPAEALRLWHSGGRGYHLTLPAVVIGAEAGHPRLPGIYRAMIDRLFPSNIAPSLDRGIYSAGRGRMWRLGNRRRSDTGRCKVPLSAREALHKPYAALEALTTRPRKGLFWLPEEELSPCPQLINAYRQAKAAIEHAAELSSSRSHDRTSQQLRSGEGVLFYAFQARGWLGDEIDAGKWALQCPWDAEHTKGECLDSSTILFAPGADETLGWVHCSHAHCAGREQQHVLALFSPGELDRAREAAGLPPQRGRLRATGTTGGLRTVQAARVPLGRTIAASEVKRWQ